MIFSIELCQAVKQLVISASIQNTIKQKSTNSIKLKRTQLYLTKSLGFKTNYNYFYQVLRLCFKSDF